MSNDASEIVHVQGPAFQRSPATRTTWAFNCYHQMPEVDAKQFQINGEVVRNLEEDAFDRSMWIEPGEEVELKFGYLMPNDVGMFVITNITGMQRPTMPTDQEKQEIEESLLQLQSPFSRTVRPRDFIAIPCDNDTAFIVKAVKHRVRIRYFGIPR